MRFYLCLALLALCVPLASAQELPGAGQMSVWAGLPESYELVTQDTPADRENAMGNLLRGRTYRPSKELMASFSSYTFYSVSIFAGGTLLRDRREQIPELLERFKHLRESGQEAASEELGNYREFLLAGGQSFCVLPGGLGPGGSSDMAIIFTDRFDLVVAQIRAERGNKDLDSRAKPTGPIPKATLPDLFRCVYNAIVEDAAHTR